MAKDSEIWKPMFILDLPYEVDKKFYQTAQSSLQEMDAPMLQSDGDFGWFSTFLKKKNVETTKFEGQSTVAGGKGVDLLRKMAALGVSCKFVVVFGLRLFILIIVSHCCFFLKKMWTCRTIWRRKCRPHSMQRLKRRKKWRIYTRHHKKEEIWLAQTKKVRMLMMTKAASSEIEKSWKET